MTKKTDGPGGEEAQIRVTNIAGAIDDTAAAEYDSGGFGAAEPENKGVISPEMAAAILKMPFSVAALYLGQHWQLDDPTAKMLSVPGAAVFSRLCGGLAERYPEAYVLGIGLLLAAAPRVAVTVAEIKQKKAAKAAGMTARPEAAHVVTVPGAA